MGPRSVLELMPFMSDLVGEEVDKCGMCHNNVVMVSNTQQYDDSHFLQGQSCSCGNKLHLYCLAKLAQRRYKTTYLWLQW